MKNLICSIAVLSCFSTPVTLFSQHDPYSNPQWRGAKRKEVRDSTSLLHAFRNGQFNGHFRNFFMATINEGDLTDYYANAIGGGLRFETAPFKGFQLGMSGYFIYNLTSVDLAKKDPLTGAANRYEIGLFDIQDPANTNNLDRLEELFLKYTSGKYRITAGKQILRFPFVNPQDGRMRPTLIEGIYAEILPNKKLKLSAGWFYKISPRGTITWFNIGKSMGVNPQGLNPDGTASNYRDHTKSAGIAIIDGSYRFNEHFNISFHNQFTENVFNTAFIQLDYFKKVKRGRFQASLQYTRQDPVANGGNADPSKTFFLPGTHANIVSTRLGWLEGNWQTSLNYTRIGKGGRFLSPREWGRDPFFTFLPRERNEGLGDVNAVMAKATRKLPKSNLQFDLGVGYYHLPDINNTAYNKYRLPSYIQSNADIKYDFKGLLEGLDLDILYVYKWLAGETYGDLSAIINKVNMSNISVVINYHF
jgi:hypothetical protein